MCGRTRCALSPEQINECAKTTNWKDQQLYKPSHNISPGTYTPVMYYQSSPEHHPVLHSMRWGLVPSFTKPDEKPDFWKMFNARSESISEKPSFRRLVPSRRCIVFINGFYEWKKEGKQKQPYYIHLVDPETGAEQPMALAGLYDVWLQSPTQTELNIDKTALPLYTYTILTTDSCKSLQWLHDRMPVILKDESARNLWLHVADSASIHRLQSILGPYNGKNGTLRWHPVTKAMSNLGFQSEEAYKEVKKPSIQSFFQPRKRKTEETKEEQSVKKPTTNHELSLKPC